MNGTKNKAQVDQNNVRKKILLAAFSEIYEHGYQAASVSNILQRTSLTKGALYYHFKDKKTLGISVIREVVKGHLDKLWILPLAQAKNPIEGVRGVIQFYANNMEMNDVRLGCPLNNLMQEMSPLDDDFRAELLKLSSKWLETIQLAIEKAKEKSLLPTSIDPEEFAQFILSSFLGIITLSKNHQSLSFYRSTLFQLDKYIASQTCE